VSVYGRQVRVNVLDHRQRGVPEDQGDEERVHAAAQHAGRGAVAEDMRSLSGNELARLAHVSPGTVSQAINGRPVATGTLAKLIRALSNVDVIPGLGDMLASPSSKNVPQDQLVQRA
jgi:hypothetical protein